MGAHTKGPWEDVGPNEEGERRIYGADNTAVAVTIPVGLQDLNPVRSVANANLIAAAPQLLAVVEELEESSTYWSEYDVPLGIVERIRGALAKARGVQS